MAYSLNRATIIGNLTRNPELRTTASGTAVASFGVATNRQWTDKNGQKQEETQFHNVVAWARLAEVCNQYLAKGRKVYVEGRLQTRDWEGQDGVKRQRTEIIIENMVMLDRAGAGAGGGAAEAATDAPPPQSTDTSAEDIKVEDIPF
jgi:single-strand DNA-binding protein